MPAAEIKPRKTPILRTTLVSGPPNAPEMTPMASTSPPGLSMMRNRIRMTAKMPSAQTIADPATGSPTSESDAASTTRPIAARAVMNRTMSMKPYAPQALTPDSGTAVPPTSTAYQSKMNITRIRATAAIPAIFSPRLSFMSATGGGSLYRRCGGSLLAEPAASSAPKLTRGVDPQEPRQQVTVLRHPPVGPVRKPRRRTEDGRQRATTG